MPKSESPRFDSRILILFLILGMVPLVVGTLILINGSRHTHRQAIGNHASEVADYAQITISNYLQQRIIQVASLTAVPVVRDAVEASNQNQLPLDELQRRVQDVESNWKELDQDGSNLLSDILNGPASKFLSDFQRYATSFREILVTDSQARLVAATNKTSDWFQGDERWWYDCYQNGEGGHYISDIHFDESAGVQAIEIAEPIMSQTDQEVIGVIKAIIDAQEIFSLVNSIEVGDRGYAALMRGDGTLLSSPEVSAGADQQYEFYGDVLSGTFQNQRSLEVNTDESRVFLGLPQTRFRETFPGLDWYVVTQQPYEEAFSTFQNVNSQFIYILIFSALVIIVLSLLFSWLLRKPIIEHDPHLEKL